MSEKTRDFKIDYHLDWEYRVSINQIRKDLDLMEELGATHLEIESHVSYDSSIIDMDVIACRLETSEERVDREEKARQKEHEVMSRELEQLRALQLKYKKESK